MSIERPKNNSGDNKANPGEYPRIRRGMDLEEIKGIHHLAEDRIRKSTDKVFGSENLEQGVQVETAFNITTNLEFPNFSESLLQRSGQFAYEDVKPQIQEHITYGLKITYPTDACLSHEFDLIYLLSKEDQSASNTIKQYASDINSISQIIAIITISKQFLPNTDCYRWKKHPIVEEISKNADKNLFATETNLTLSKMVLYYERYLEIYGLDVAPADETTENLDKISRQFVTKFKEINKNNTSNPEEKKKIQEILSLMLYVYPRLSVIFGICDMIDCLDENDQK